MVWPMISTLILVLACVCAPVVSQEPPQEERLQLQKQWAKLKLARPINVVIPGAPPQQKPVTAKSGVNVQHSLPAVQRVNRRVGAPAGAPGAAPPPLEPPPPSAPPAMAPPPADAPPGTIGMEPMAPAPAEPPPVPLAPAPASAPAAGEPLFAEPPAVPEGLGLGAEPPPVMSGAAIDAAAELEKDANQAAATENKLDTLKNKMLGEMGGPAAEGPKIQAAIGGFVARERMNLHNLETELQNAALA